MHHPRDRGTEVQIWVTMARYREEDRPAAVVAMRGFMMIQSAMAMLMRKVPISCEGLYAILAFLKRNKAKKSPRAVRFELTPGKPVSVVLEPFEKRIDMATAIYQAATGSHPHLGPRPTRCCCTACCSLCDGPTSTCWAPAAVLLVVKDGDLRLTPGLSGIANDWTSGGPRWTNRCRRPNPVSVDGRDRGCVQHHADAETQPDPAEDQSPGRLLRRVEQVGPVRPTDPRPATRGVYRWRSILPVAVSAEQLGPRTQTAGAKKITSNRSRRPGREGREEGLRQLEGHRDRHPVELTMDRHAAW